MIVLYGYPPSGNCWKVAQLLTFLGIPFRWEVVNSNRDETRTPAFLAKFPHGQVPGVELADGTRIGQSNAILLHFAEGTPWLPPPGLARTRVAEWLFFEQYSHEPNIAVARNIVAFLHEQEQQAERLARCRTGGEAALSVMQHRLTDHDWLTDVGPTAADIALCAYSQVADQGGFDLARWPGVRDWVARFQALPGFLPLART